MSFPKKGKSFPKSGRAGASDFSIDDHAFAMKIASALKSELRNRNSRAKLVAGWTGANERTVKNWILGRYAPCGRHLVVLAQHSDQVLDAILSMAGRQDLLLAQKIEDLRRKVSEMAAIIGEPYRYDPDALIQGPADQCPWARLELGSYRVGRDPRALSAAVLARLGGPQSLQSPQVASQGVPAAPLRRT
jgi:hypothetical protein